MARGLRLLLCYCALRNCICYGLLDNEECERGFGQRRRSGTETEQGKTARDERLFAWHAALFRPDVFPAVAGLSVPFRQRGPAPPLQMLRKAGLLTHYWFHFQEPGVAEAEFERNPRTALRRVLYSISGDAPRETRELTLLPGKGWLANTLDPENLPDWFTDADLDHMTAEFARSGFRGGLNWYRNIDRNWELTAPWAGAVIRQPALFIAGSLDPVITSGSGAAAVQALPTTVPGLRRKLLIEGAGHFIQQERPQIVNEAILEFLGGLAQPSMSC